MNTMAWPPRIGAWYLRWDKGEIFQVTAYDEKSRIAHICAYNGDCGELDQFAWDRLAVGPADPPEDWTAPLETVDVVRFGSAGNDPVSEDTAEAPPAP